MCSDEKAVMVTGLPDREGLDVNQEGARPAVFLQQMISDTIQWVADIQNDDGGFPSDHPGLPSGTWVSAGLLWSLLEAGTTFDEGWLRRALDWLISQTNPDGGLPKVAKGDPSVVDATAQFAIDLSYAWKQGYRAMHVGRSLAAAAEWLVSNKDPGKGWTWWPRRDSTCWVATSSYALIALARLFPMGYERARPAIDEAAEWLMSLRTGDSSWPAFEGGSARAVTTAFALLALLELGVFTASDCKQSSEFIVMRQHSDGSWDNVVDRPLARTVNRVAIPYCLMALVRSGLDLSSPPIQMGTRCLIEHYVDGHFWFLRDTAQFTWPTRDGLLALVHLSSGIGAAQVASLVDDLLRITSENAELGNEVERLRQVQESHADTIEEAVAEAAKEEQQKLGVRLTIYRAFAIASPMVIGLLAIWIAALCLPLSTTDIAAAITALSAAWGAWASVLVTRG